MATSEEIAKVMEDFIEEHKDNPGLLKHIGKLIENGKLVEEIERQSSKHGDIAVLALLSDDDDKED
jgi:hypothetical protein